MSFKEYYKGQVGQDEFSLNKEDLRTWLKDYNEVKQQIAKWVDECTVLGNPTYKLCYIMGRIHNNNAYSICSDTSEPLEYVDFNYGSITCTISTYNREEPELLPCFDGYIRRNDIEQEGCHSDMDFDEILDTYLDL